MKRLTTNGTNQGNVELSERDYNDLINANMDNKIVKEILTPYKKPLIKVFNQLWFLIIVLMVRNVMGIKMFLQHY